MAKTNNIKLPDGTTVSLPAWASESTLNTLLGQLKVSSRFYKALTDLIAKGDYDASKLSQAIKKNSKQQQDSDNRENKAERKSRENFAKTIAKRTNDIVGQFSNTDKPLSSLTDNLHQLSKGLGGTIQALAGKNAAFGKLMAGFTKNSEILSGGIDVAFAYLGFQAARVEQFSKAQENMISAGAIFYDSAKTFDDLYSGAARSGISYQKFTELVSQHGVGMQILGDGVSGGAKKFNEFFGVINKAGDQFGDWGLSNENMAEVYADYINVARLTGTITHGMTDVLDKSKTGFTELMNETSALASLTGQSRDKIIRDRFAALSDSAAASGILKLREAGMHEQADAAEAILSQLALAGDALGQPGVELANAIGKSLQMKGDDIANFDIQDVLNQTNPDIIAAFNQMSPGFIESINTAIKTGNVTGNMSTFILDQWKLMKANIDASMQTQLEGPAALIYEIEKGAIIVNRDFKNITGLTTQELNRKIQDQEKKLAESGKGVVALNDMTAVYLTAMAKLTYPLQDSAAMAASLAAALRTFIGSSDAEHMAYPDETTDNSSIYTEALSELGITELTAQDLIDNPSISPRFEDWLKNHPQASEDDIRTEATIASGWSNQANINAASDGRVVNTQDKIIESENGQVNGSDKSTTFDGMSAVEIMQQEAANYNASLKNLHKVISSGYFGGMGFNMQDVY